MVESTVVSCSSVVADLVSKSISQGISSFFQWSFGVTLWEMFTMAHQPYAEVDPFEMAAYLLDGFRMAQPINCPNEL